MPRQLRAAPDALQRRAAELERLREAVDQSTLAQSQTEATGELTTVDNHPGDTADFAYQRELDQTIEHVLDEHEQQIRRAQDARAAGRYGICEDCGRPIEPARLAVRPEATRCVECQRWREQRQPADRGADLERFAR